MVAILKILNDGYHNNQVMCPDILYDLLHSWPSIHTISCKYSHADRSYINFEFLVVAIFIFLMEAITKSGDMSTHLTINTHIFMQIFTCMSFQWRGDHCTSQITCLHFLCDSNNNKLSMHKISCKYIHA